MKNGKVLILLTLVILAEACTGGTGAQRVRIDVEPRRKVLVEEYKQLLYGGMTGPDDPQTEALRNLGDTYFPGEFAHLLNLPAQRAETRLAASPPATRTFSGIPDWKGKVGDLLLTCMARCETSLKSQIRRIKAADGKKRRQLVDTTEWQLHLHVVLQAGGGGEVVFSKTYQADLSGKQLDSERFNREALFFRLTDQVLRDLVRRPRKEDRYLLGP